MKTIERCSWGFFAFCTIFLLHEAISKLFFLHSWLKMGPADWAAWAQAIGSVAAVVAAIWIMNEQHRAMARRESDAIRQRRRNLGRSLKHELSSYHGALQSIEAEFDSMDFHFFSYLNRVFPNPSVQFSNYDGLTYVMGEISDDQLLGDIISAYAEIRNVFAIVEQNSQLCEMVSDIVKGQQAVEAMKKIAPQLKSRLENLTKRIERINKGLDKLILENA